MNISNCRLLKCLPSMLSVKRDKHPVKFQDQDKLSSMINCQDFAGFRSVGSFVKLNNEEIY